MKQNNIFQIYIIQVDRWPTCLPTYIITSLPTCLPSYLPTNLPPCLPALIFDILPCYKSGFSTSQLVARMYLNEGELSGRWLSVRVILRAINLTDKYNCLREFWIRARFLALTGKQRAPMAGGGGGPIGGQRAHSRFSESVGRAPLARTHVSSFSLPVFQLRTFALRDDTC